MSTTQPATETYTMPANSEAWYQMAMGANEDIRNRESELMDVLSEIESQRKELALIETGIVQDVAGETEGGKPRYSNESSRKAETAIRLEASPTYQAFKELLRQGERKRQIVQIELSEAQRMFSLAKYGLRAQGA